MALHHRLIGKAARMVWRITKPRTFGVRAILLDEHGRIALVRHTYADHWYLPGGGVKKGESAHAALLRELEKEVAVAGPIIEGIVGVYHSRAEGKDDHIVIFAVRTSSQTGEMRRADRLEVAAAEWFPPDQLPSTTSPATRRRIDEYRRGVTGAGTW